MKCSFATKLYAQKELNEISLPNTHGRHAVTANGDRPNQPQFQQRLRYHERRNPSQLE
jgi:hypothetical protein